MQFLIAFPCDGQPTIYFESLPQTWTHKRQDSKLFESAQDAASFAKSLALNRRRSVRARLTTFSDTQGRESEHAGAGRWCGLREGR